MATENISINVQNTTTATIDVSIMGNPSDLADNANATTEYRWNVTGLTFAGENRISVQYRANAINDFTVFSATLQEQSVNGLVSALNTLGIGSFFTFTSGGNTFISNYDDDYVFGVINIYVLGVPQIIYNVSLANVGGNIGITGGFSPPLNLISPITQSGTFTTASGDYITTGGTSPAVGNTNLSIVISTTGSVLYSNNLPPSTTWGYVFTTLSGDYTYVITYTNP